MVDSRLLGQGILSTEQIRFGFTMSRRRDGGVFEDVGEEEESLA